MIEDQLLSELEQSKKTNNNLKTIQLQDKYIELLQQKNNSLENEIMNLWQKITKLIKSL